MWSDLGRPPSLVVVVWHLSAVHLDQALFFITPCYISLHCTQLSSAESFELIFWHQC